MSRKVFISILGTSFYEECTYGTADFKSKNTRFIQEATLEYLKVKEWDSQDQVFIVLSETAKKNNWFDSIKERKKWSGGEMIPCEYEGLETVLSKMELPVAVETIDIPDGKTEKEMWDIFGAIFNKLQDGDELYIDLTHSFRYMPMLLLVLANYAGFLKSTKTVYVSYGNFEAGKNSENGVAPIMDLNPLVELQSWANAAADYLHNGYPNALKELADKSLSPLLRNEETRDEDTMSINKFVKKLVLLSDEHQTCRGKDLYEGQTIRNLHEIAANIESVGISALAPIFNKVKSSLYSPQENSALNVINSAQWCFEKGLIQQSVTLLLEGIISHIAPKYEIGVEDSRRDIISSAFKIKKENKPEEKWKGKAAENKELTRNILDNEPLIQDAEFVDNFIALGNLRNDFNHAGFRENAMNVNSIKRNLETYLKYFSDKLDPNCQTEEMPNSELKPALLLNLSNHPSERWSDKQVEEARKYGEIVDMLFPQIAPECTDDELDKLVDDYYHAVKKYSSSSKVTVHLMGEMTFTYRLVSKLKDASIPCIAATTYREVEEMPNGDKVVHFDFQQFRRY